MIYYKVTQMVRRIKKFYPWEVIERKYSIEMLHYLAYLFPDKKFSLHEFDMYDAMFMKGYGEGYLAGEIAAQENQ